MEFWPLSDGFNAKKFCTYIYFTVFEEKDKETGGESFMC